MQLVKIRNEKITRQKSTSVKSFPQTEGYVPLPGYTSQSTLAEKSGIWHWQGKI